MRFKFSWLTLGAVLSSCLALALLGLYSAKAMLYPSLSHFEGQPFGGDFWQFWPSGRLVLAGFPEGPYSPEMMTSSMASLTTVNHGVLSNPLYYPPTWLLILTPFALLPYFPALLAFIGFSFAVFMTGLRAWVKETRVLLVMLSFSGILLNLLMGQNGLLTAGLFSLGMAFLPVNPALAGLFIGLLSFKPQLGLLIPLALIAGREWQALKVAFVTTLGFIGLSILCFGMMVWVESLGGMLMASAVLGDNTKLLLRIPSFFSFARLSSLDGLVHIKYFGPAYTTAGVAMLLQLAFALPCVIAVLWVWARHHNPRLRAAALACGILLVTPFLYDYDQALLAVPILTIGLEADRTRWFFHEKILLPLAMAWPILVAKLPYALHFQIGFVMPLVLLGAVLVRVAKEPQSALNPSV